MFDTRESQETFLASFGPQSSHIKFNVSVDNIIEAILPECLIQSSIGEFVKIQILDSIRSRMMYPVDRTWILLEECGYGLYELSTITCHRLYLSNCEGSDRTCRQCRYNQRRHLKSQSSIRIRSNGVVYTGCAARKDKAAQGGHKAERLSRQTSKAFQGHDLGTLLRVGWWVFFVHSWRLNRVAWIGKEVQVIRIRRENGKLYKSMTTTTWNLPALTTIAEED